MKSEFFKTVSIAAFLAISTPVMSASVTLQGSTPGTPDTGNINVTGTIIGGDLQGNTLEVSGNTSIGGSLSVNTIDPTSALTVGDTSNSLNLQGSNVTVSANASGITNTLTFATPSASNKTITIPDQSGTVCLDSNNCGAVKLQPLWPGTVQTGIINVSGEIKGGNIYGSIGSFSGSLTTTSTLFSQTIKPVSPGSAMILNALPGALKVSGGSIWMDVTTGSGNTSVRIDSPTTFGNIITFPSSSGTVCVTNKCDGYATQSLNNLQSIAINTSLLPATSGSANLGSAAKPFGSLYLSSNASVGSLTVGGGTPITKHLSATSSQGGQSLASSAPGCNSFSIAVTGAAMGDTVVAAIDQSLPGTWTLSGNVSAADTVTVKACAFDNSTSIAAGTYRVDVWKH